MARYNQNIGFSETRTESDEPTANNNAPGSGEEESFGMAKLLESIGYPATKDDILDFAEAQGSSPEVLDMLEQLPDTTYNDPADVSQAIGENANMVT